MQDRRNRLASFFYLTFSWFRLTSHSHQSDYFSQLPFRDTAQLDCQRQFPWSDCDKRTAKSPTQAQGVRLDAVRGALRTLRRVALLVRH